MNLTSVDVNNIGKMNWYDAMNYCKNNTNWKLPTRQELNEIYKSIHKIESGRFENTYHWTSDELSSQYGWSINFETGVQHYYTKLHENNVILIKNK